MRWKLWEKQPSVDDESDEEEMSLDEDEEATLDAELSGKYAAAKRAFTEGLETRSKTNNKLKAVTGLLPLVMLGLYAAGHLVFDEQLTIIDAYTHPVNRAKVGDLHDQVGRSVPDYLNSIGAGDLLPIYEDVIQNGASYEFAYEALGDTWYTRFLPLDYDGVRIAGICVAQNMTNAIKRMDTMEKFKAHKV